MPPTQAAVKGPPGLSPTVTAAPRSVSRRQSSVTSTGCVAAAVSGFMRATRLAFTAIFMPGSTQPRPPSGSSAASSAARAVSGA